MSSNRGFYRAYTKWAPRGQARADVQRADQIVAQYQAEGYDLTLRQLYYQFVARGWLPNKQASYKALGETLNRARLAGMLDWYGMVDRTRNLRRLSHWESPGGILQGAAASFQRDPWIHRDQTQYVEVWVEKEALAGVVSKAADRLHVPWFSCRGYVSQSEMWVASRRLRSRLLAGRAVTIIHLGDHDPSGIDMTRDITDRLEMFIATDRFMEGGQVDGNGYAAQLRGYQQSLRDPSLQAFTVDRIALNMDQIEEFQPPPNPAKITDSRFESYRERFGDESWELDALEPATLDNLITDAIMQRLNMEAFDEVRDSDIDDQRRLQNLADNWEDALELLREADWWPEGD